jgi:hypothetical protein
VLETHQQTRNAHTWSAGQETLHVHGPAPPQRQVAGYAFCASAQLLLLVLWQVASITGSRSTAAAALDCNGPLLPGQRLRWQLQYLNCLDEFVSMILLAFLRGVLLCTGADSGYACHLQQ